MSTPANESENSPSEDVRRKFREALARKNGKHEEHHSAVQNSVTNPNSSPAKTKRTHRRKSG